MGTMNLVRASALGIAIVLLAWAAAPPPAAAAALDPVGAWNELALDTIRVKRASDAQAARLYAMVNVAMYDAVMGGIHFEFSNQAGLASGRAVAAEILATRLLRVFRPVTLRALPALSGGPGKPTGRRSLY